MAAWGTLLACNLDPGKEPWVPESAPARKAELRPREPCAQRDPLRRALFGDLHVHTGFSMDAWVQGTLTDPDAAYRFARGEEIGVPPYDASGRPASTLRIDRPLDFAAVTDHAEWLGEVGLCRDPGSAAYDTESCRVFRGEVDTILARVLGLQGFRRRLLGAVSLRGRNEEICGEGSSRCRAETRTAWQANQEATERWYDRSGTCAFTSFHGYEYSRSPSSTKIHRNVIFRNEIVPELPISWIDTPSEQQLWSKLHSQCLDTDSGCDALAIPHNPNLSNGRLFTIPYRDRPLAEQRAEARTRAALEPVVEMVQYKGESECRNGFAGVVGGPDELCDFEKIRDLPGEPLEDCGEGTGAGAQKDRGCTSRLDYVRYALVEGLREAERIGVNPYVFGFVGGTDTHLANPGAVAEAGAVVVHADTTRDLLTIGKRPKPAPFRSAGGLAGVWAEENSRDAIFDALERRETFATSGTRIVPRLFAGWDLPEDLCSRSDLVGRADAGGVPMGGVLPARPAPDAPLRFVARADRDPRGAPLQRIQIVKAWHGGDGAFHQAVHDIVRVAPGASVDVESCALRGEGAESLCATWVDPDFDPGQAAVYYARIVENPSCRWTTWACLRMAEEGLPEACTDPRVPPTIQERAWTSPIWYTPAEGYAPAEGDPPAEGYAPVEGDAPAKGPRSAESD
ncbi:MAG: DUF3604 domain-containing protein [Myxococcota bacterium]